MKIRARVWQVDQDEREWNGGDPWAWAIIDLNRISSSTRYLARGSAATLTAAYDEAATAVIRLRDWFMPRKRVLMTGRMRGMRIQTDIARVGRDGIFHSRALGEQFGAGPLHYGGSSIGVPHGRILERTVEHWAEADA